MLGRPVRPSVWEITGNVGLLARMRNGGWWRWKLKSENWKLRDVLAWETENQRRFVLPRRKVTNVSKVHYQRKKERKMVQSSLFHYAKCNHWAPKTGLQLRWGEEGTNLRFAKASRCRRSSTVSVNLWKRGFVQHLHCRDSMYISWFLSFSMKTAQVGCRDKLLAISFSSNFYVRVLDVFRMCTKSGLKK